MTFIIVESNERSLAGYLPGRASRRGMMTGGRSYIIRRMKTTSFTFVRLYPSLPARPSSLSQLPLLLSVTVACSQSVARRRLLACVRALERANPKKPKPLQQLSLLLSLVSCSFFFFCGAFFNSFPPVSASQPKHYNSHFDLGVCSLDV